MHDITHHISTTQMRTEYVTHLLLPMGGCVLHAGAVLVSHLDPTTTAAVARHVPGCAGPVQAATTWQRVHPPGIDGAAYLLVWDVM